MKKTALLFIAVLVILASIDFIWPFTTERTDGDVFGQGLNTAEMQTYQDSDLGFTVRYPSFFAVQPDSLDEYTGHVRFSYDNEWATVVLECYALRNYGQSLKSGMDSLAQVLHATDCKLGSDYFILSGPQYENDSRIDDYSYYSRLVSRGKLSSADSSRKSTTGRCSRISAQVSAVPTVSCLMPHAKVTKRKEPFSIMNKITDTPRNVTKPLNICSDFHPRQHFFGLVGAFPWDFL